MLKTKMIKTKQLLLISQVRMKMKLGTKVATEAKTEMMLEKKQMTELRVEIKQELVAITPDINLLIVVVTVSTAQTAINQERIAKKKVLYRMS